ncbi:MAG: polyprenyl synthetase family protein, partial [Pseudomonadota bacterium]
YGEDTAILAAVGLINLAYRGVNADQALSGEQRSRISLILADAVGPGGLTGGQYDDLKADRSNAEVDGVEHIHLRKTARLFAAAAEIGAVASGQDRFATDLHQFGESIGLAFQAFDDLLDAKSDIGAVGKDVGKDTDKATVIALLGVDNADARAQAHMSNAEKALDPLPGDASAVLIGYANDLVEGMKANAKR